QVSIYTRLSSQLAAKFLAAGLHRAAEDKAVGAREVHMLKDATGCRRGRGVEARIDSFRADDDQFSRFYVADILGADQVKRTGLGGKDDGVLLLSLQRGDAAHGLRAESAAIAHREDTVITHHHQGKCA